MFSKKYSKLLFVIIMGIGILVDGVVFKKIEDKVMTRWGLR